MTQNKDQQESTWETEELGLWLLNDEGLYHSAYWAARRGGRALQQWAEDIGEINWEFLGYDFDWDEIDWDEVADTLAGDDE